MDLEEKHCDGCGLIVGADAVCASDFVFYCNEECYEYFDPEDFAESANSVR